MYADKCIHSLKIRLHSTICEAIYLSFQMKNRELINFGAIVSAWLHALLQHLRL